MKSDDSATKKVSKIRTFQSDITSVKQNKGESLPTETAKVTTEAPITKKVPEQTIFRKPSKELVPVIEPRIVEDNVVKETSLPVKTNQTVAPTPLKNHVEIQPSEQIPKIINQDLPTKSFPKENLDSIAINDASSEGSIITDQKRTSFSLMSSVVEAVQTWLADEKELIKDKAETKRKSIPTVRPVETRKEILQKAAVQSAMAPKDDHQQLATKFSLPKRAPEQEVAPVQIKKKLAPVKPSWSHFEGVQNKEVSKEIKQATPPVTEKINEKYNKTFLPETPVKTEVPEPKPSSPLQTKELETKPTPPIATPPIPTKQEAPKTPAVKLVGVKNNTPFNIKALLTYGGIAIVVVLAVTSGAGLVWWLFSNNSNQSTTVNLPEENPQPIRQELVAYQNNVITKLPLRKEELWQSVLSTRDTTNPSLILVSLMNSENTPATPAEILRTMNWPSNSAFLTNIERINLGTYSGIPFIVIRTTSFDTAFGGLLSAESTLLEDLDIFAEDNNEIVTENFIDELVQNHDVRILRNQAGLDVIVYGFVNRNIIIITANKSSFSEIANLIR